MATAASGMNTPPMGPDQQVQRPNIQQIGQQTVKAVQDSAYAVPGLMLAVAAVNRQNLLSQKTLMQTGSAFASAALWSLLDNYFGDVAEMTGLDPNLVSIGGATLTQLGLEMLMSGKGYKMGAFVPALAIQASGEVSKEVLNKLMPASS